ncbi:hypothetical protein JVT61DRAFT_11001 [Boletus reticuloceps]|uniref:Uncharacterized protein n=1 Tax=Boletus reticuloceps TaxID=495285 RepID=A0A8I2YEX5_9AGAM|nr:hypothetical protein JVT61DRAFT_11001 [Boletus reticuloceps]
MDSFSPFVPLLPKQAQEIWRNGLFDVYAYRVQRIRPRDGYLDRALYQRLAFIRTGINPFPRLLSLQYYLFHPLTPGVKIFPSSLHRLSLYPEYTIVLDGRAELALRQAAQDAPFLEELYISGIYRLHLGQDYVHWTSRSSSTVQLIANVLRPADFQNFSRLLSTSPIRNLGISVRSSSEPSDGHLYISSRSGWVACMSTDGANAFADFLPLVDVGLVGLRVEMSLYGAWKVEEDIKKRLRPEAWPSLTCFEFVLTEASTVGTSRWLGKVP